MSSLAALLIGLLQGLTEFFPVSSSAHIKLAKIFLGIECGEETVLFDLSCHLGTLCAVLWFFRQDIRDILFLRDKKSFGLLFLGTLPLVPFYFLLKPLREAASAPEFLGPFLMVTALILFAGQKLRFRDRGEKMSALCVGAMQAAALIPGISRSASTISCGMAFGWSAERAVRFSFLLAIPTVIGGNCVELLRLKCTQSLSFSSCLIGFLSSLGMGVGVIRYAIPLLQRGNFKPFAWYCLLAGIGASLYLWLK